MRTTWMLVLATVGCGGGKKGPTADELLAQLAPIVEPKLQAIEKLLKEPFPAPTGSIKLDGPPLALIQELGERKLVGNALYAFEPDLRTLDRYQRNPLRYNFSGEFINDCFQIVREKRLAGGDFATYSRDPLPWTHEEHIVGMKLPHCAALRYLLVVKVDAFQKTKYIDAEKFGGGGAAAQIHVFDLEAGGKHLGGVPFSAQSSNYVSNRDIDGDLRENFYTSLELAVRAQLPDANL